MKYLIIAICFFSTVSLSNEAPQDSAFQEWLSALRAEALDKGISGDTVSEALGDVRYIERAVQADRAQAEFKESYQDYIRKRVSDWRIDKGRQYLEQYGPAMLDITKAYGVPSNVIAAIIGVETNYGSFELKHEALNVLSTLAFDARRGARFRKEIFAVLRMLDKGFADKELLKSSWAGALGVPQFMPSTYLDFA